MKGDADLMEKKIAHPDKIHVVEMPDGEFKPLYVAAPKIDKVIMGISLSTWANWRYMKIGPRYHKINNRVYYKISDLEEYFGRNPILTIDCFDQ